jgi:hypothetical protein
MTEAPEHEDTETDADPAGEPDPPSEGGNRPPPDDPTDDPASNPPDELEPYRGG